MQIDSVRRADEAPAQTDNPTFRSPICDKAVREAKCPERSESFEVTHEFIQEQGLDEAEPEILAGIRKNFSRSGRARKCRRRPLTVKNYAAELTRDCAALLALLGRKPEQNLREMDFAKCVNAAPEGAAGFRSVLSVNDEARPGLEEAGELALRIRLRAGEAACRYQNGLPLKAALLLRQTLTAAMKEGLI